MHRFPNGYALLIGIADYSNALPRPPETVVRDVIALRNLFINPIRGGYPLDHVKLLINNLATSTQIRANFRWLAEKTSPSDTVVIYFAGHGIQIEHGVQVGSFLLPVDAASNNLEETSIDGAELTELLHNIKASRMLCIFDCCHADQPGTIVNHSDDEAVAFKSGVNEHLYTQLATQPGRAVIATSRSSELALSPPHLNHSLFTHQFMAALRGDVEGFDGGPPKIFEIFTHVKNQIAQQTTRQHPLFRARSETDFPITYPKIFRPESHWSHNDYRRQFA